MAEQQVSPSERAAVWSQASPGAAGLRLAPSPPGISSCVKEDEEPQGPDRYFYTEKMKKEKK